MAQIVDEAQASEAIQALKDNGRFVVLHTGCYEVLHAGHIACFTAGKDFNAAGKPVSLVVGVESDPTLRLNREDKDRPLFSQDERAHVIAQLRQVDLVVRFAPTIAAEYADILFFTDRLKKLSPDALLISYNSAIEYFNEVAQLQARECADAGVAILPVVHNVRTRATVAVDLLNRQPHIPGMWQPAYKQADRPE